MNIKHFFTIFYNFLIFILRPHVNPSSLLTFPFDFAFSRLYFALLALYFSPVCTLVSQTEFILSPICLIYAEQVHYK